MEPPSYQEEIPGIKKLSKLYTQKLQETCAGFEMEKQIALVQYQKKLKEIEYKEKKSIEEMDKLMTDAFSSLSLSQSTWWKFW